MTIATESCGALESAGLVPLASATGTLPHNYSGVLANFTDLPTDSSTVDCTITIRDGPVGKVRTCVSLDQSPFRLALNGVTVTCQAAEIGDTGVVNGIEYTKRDRDGLIALVGDADTEAELATSCTTGVEDMSELFGYVEDVRDFNVGTFNLFTIRSNVANPAEFNPDLSTWDMSSVMDMSSMMAGATAFEGDVSAWDTSKVVNMSFALAGNDVFNSRLDAWNTSSAVDMRGMLFEALAFNQNLDGLVTSRATNTSYLLFGAQGFNNGEASGSSTAPLLWDTSGSGSMKFTFSGAASFNQPVDGFDMSRVTDSAAMCVHVLSLILPS